MILCILTKTVVINLSLSKGHYQAFHLYYLELEIIRIVDQRTHMCVSEWTLQLVSSALDLYLIINSTFAKLQCV
jgi:hypothetical protein